MAEAKFGPGLGIEMRLASELDNLPQECTAFSYEARMLGWL